MREPYSMTNNIARLRVIALDMGRGHCPALAGAHCLNMSKDGSINITSNLYFRLVMFDMRYDWKLKSIIDAFRCDTGKEDCKN